MEDLKCGLAGFGRGVYDSIAGIGVVVTLQAEQKKTAARRAADAASQPVTTLARRRAQALVSEASSPTVEQLVMIAATPHITQLQKHPSSPSPPLRTSREEPLLIYRICQCCLLNGGVFLCSILSFDFLLLPAVQALIVLLFGNSQGSSADSIWTWLQPLLVCTFQALWVLPLFLLSKVVNSLWFQDIADIAFRYITGGNQRFLPSLSRILSDVLFSVLVQTLFLFQSLLVGALPIGRLGELVSLVHLSLLYSLYAFEYIWFSRGWELHRRLSFIEDNWPYFVGFGLPLAVITSWFESYFLSGCFFSLLFPLFILSAHGVTPATGTARFPLQLFSPSIWVSNAIFHRVTANCPTKPVVRPTVPRQKRSSVTRELHKKSASKSASPHASRQRTAITPS